MDVNISNLYQELPKDICVATKLLIETFLYKLYPYLQKIGNNIQTSLKNEDCQEKIMGIHNIFSVCVSQISKCYSLMFDIFKLEDEKVLLLLESRQCTLERLSWCCSRLVAIEQRLVEENKQMYNSCPDVSIFSTPMYFVNWIDQTFNILKDITNLVSNINKSSDKLFDDWKNKVIDYLSSLRTSIDELLLSAMTLCRHCLPTDQHIIKVRCQVVLRETKSLFSNVIHGDIDKVFDSTVIPLKLPIKPSSVNVLIDVLKDALYVLETNTNTALLALLVHCFSYNTSPADILKEHYNSNSKGNCLCVLNNQAEIPETCTFVKDFDLYNERLLQIGSFAISCSSDDKRILAIRSNLASLEALDPHLVPALIMSPESNHTTLLRNTWNREVIEIRDSVFLIVDPAAFSEKARQMMHQKLLDIIKENVYNNSLVCSVINIGCVVYDFFDVYNKYEPHAISEPETMLILLADLNKVQTECKVVSDLLSSGDDYVYNFEKSKLAKNITFQQILKRLKLLYTIVNKINTLQKPKDDNELLDEEMTIGTYEVTHTVNLKNNETYINSPRKNFARTTVNQTPSRIPLFKLTKHLKQKDMKDFSLQLDELCNGSEMKFLADRDSVTFFYSPLKKRKSIRQAVLDRQTFINENEKVHEIPVQHDKSFLDQSLDLQITEVLHRINDLTVTFSTRPYHQRGKITNCHRKLDKEESKQKLNETVTKYIRDCFINTECLDSHVSLPTNVSEPSNVTTLERLNDLDLVESKLSDLRMKLFETSL